MKRGKSPASKAATGVYWGRFNPPHQGHLSVIRRLRDQCRLVVAIGSSEHKNEKTNPFSGAERKAMLESYLQESGIRGVRVVSLNDGRSRSWAVENLVRKCQPDVLYLSDESSLLAELAERRIPVVRFPRTGTISSTRIRDSIASGDDRWKALTGRSVARLIVEMDGPRRIQRAYGRGRPADPAPSRRSGRARTPGRRAKGNAPGPR